MVLPSHLHSIQQWITQEQREETVSTSIKQLPLFYTDVQPVAQDTTEYTVPKANGNLTPGHYVVDNAIQEEQSWLKNVQSIFQQTETSDDEQASVEHLSWASHHAAMITRPVCPKCESALLPLFQDQAHTVAMVRHSLSLVKVATHHANPGQIPNA